MEHRYALGDAIDPIEYQAVQMDVEVGGRANRLPEGHRAGVGFGAFESRLFNQKCRYGPVDDLQDRREERGMCSEQQAQRDRKREHPLAAPAPGGRSHPSPGGRRRAAGRHRKGAFSGAWGEAVLSPPIMHRA